jgi:hypothetical protein
LPWCTLHPSREPARLHWRGVFIRCVPPELTTSRLARSLAPLFFERVDEILPAQRIDDVLGIVEKFEQNVVASANAVKDDTFLIAATFTMRFAWETRGIAADGTNLFECAIGFVKTMLALYDERVSER